MRLFTFMPTFNLESYYEADFLPDFLGASVFLAYLFRNYNFSRFLGSGSYTYTKYNRIQ